MAFTADLTTDIGKVRLFLMDMDSTNPIFPDDMMIQNLLDAEGGDTKGATAFGMEIIAGNQQLLLKTIQLLDLKQDGFSVAKGLLATAKQIREFANNDWAGIDFAQVTDNSEFSIREFLWKRMIQGAF